MRGSHIISHHYHNMLYGYVCYARIWATFLLPFVYTQQLMNHRNASMSLVWCQANQSPPLTWQSKQIKKIKILPPITLAIDVHLNVFKAEFISIITPPPCQDYQVQICLIANIVIHFNCIVIIYSLCKLYFCNCWWDKKNLKKTEPAGETVDRKFVFI